MGLTVKDVMQLPVMGTSKVKTGKEILDQKVIEWISVIEIPVENFVRRNELVLTTGIGCEDDPLLLEKFVKDVIYSGASVLAFATGRYVYEIPDRIIQLAKQHDFIIIDIPWEIRFGDILHVVLHEIHKDKQGERQQAEDVRQELINCVLHNKGLKDITRILNKHIQMPVAIMDNTKTTRSSHQFSKKLLLKMTGELSGQIQQIPSSDILYNDHPLYHQIEEYMVDNQIVYQVPIINNQNKEGFLLFQSKDREQLTWFVLNVLEHAITACALWFVKENAIEMTEVRLKDNFILDLAKKHTNVTNKLISKGQLLGYDLNRPYIVSFVILAIMIKAIKTIRQRTVHQPHLYRV
ncbi:MAG: PucR family transcriptional regulator ligand-binding domain-containing protein [Bacillus sp. (in: Bacteria)]|nr:PucR family transcriptional regulator ligand-binding domain-containing protein [Bacillus sp. (in: firmicutes)]